MQRAVRAVFLAPCSRAVSCAWCTLSRIAPRKPGELRRQRGTVTQAGVVVGESVTPSDRVVTPHGDDGSSSFGLAALDDVTSSSTAKLAELVATRIEKDIMARGWPVGEVLGSEAELIRHYGVSRAVFREAVRIVEHHQAARMRRGPHGGLIVTAPDLSSVLWPALLYLAQAGARIGEMWGLRRAVELESIRVVAERLDEAGIARLRRALEEEEEAQRVGDDANPNDPRSRRGFHMLIAELTGNPTAILFTGLLLNLAYYRFDPLTRESLERIAVEQEHHREIAEALIAGDVAVAQHRMRAHLDYVEDFVERRSGASPS